MSIRTFYDHWPQYNSRLIEAVRHLTPEQLAIEGGYNSWPIWATVGHTAAMRAYWLCTVVGEPIPEGLPFADPEEDWADDLDHPRSAEELVLALETSFAAADAVLDAWTPEMLSADVERNYGGSRQLHSRASIIQRMMTHEAWHAAEVSEALARHGLEGVDLWRRAS